MSHIKKIAAVITAVVASYSVSMAQNPVTLDCESGKKSTDAAACWDFVSSNYSKSDVITKSYSLITGAINGTEKGIISPWTDFNGSGAITWNMMLDGWSGKGSVDFVLLLEDEANPGKLDTLYSFAFNSKNATSVESASVKNTFKGVGRLHFYFVGSSGSDKGIIDDISIDGDYFSSPSSGCASLTKFTDSDGDGVADKLDAYPKDSTKAYVFTYPAKGPGTMMFEDNWPSAGDYDLNDLVADYQYEAVLNGANQVVDITFNVTARASGGNYHNGLMLQFDKLTPDYIDAVSGSFESGANWVTHDANGTEKGQKYANILLFDDIYNLMTGSKGFINTVPGTSGVKPVTTNIKVSFTANPKKRVTMDDISINPYMIAAQTRGLEVHFANRVPTDLVNAKLFGTEDDNATPGKGVYYTNKSGNLPWGILVDDESIPYLQEGLDFVSGYPYILNWIKSGGSTDNDWYTSGKRNSKVMY